MSKFKLTQQKYNEKIAIIIMETIHMHPEMTFIDVLNWLGIINNVDNITSENLYNNINNI
jgi:hypothetical protein